jgi:hypothetical protein
VPVPAVCCCCVQIIKFVGCYHGHADSFLVKAGSGVATLGLPDSPGQQLGLWCASMGLRGWDKKSLDITESVNQFLSCYLLQQGRQQWGSAVGDAHESILFRGQVGGCKGSKGYWGNDLGVTLQGWQDCTYILHRCPLPPVVIFTPAGTHIATSLCRCSLLHCCCHHHCHIQKD